MNVVVRSGKSADLDDLLGLLILVGLLGLAVYTDARKSSFASFFFQTRSSICIKHWKSAKLWNCEGGLGWRGASTCGAQLADNTNSRYTFDDNGDDDDRCV